MSPVGSNNIAASIAAVPSRAGLREVALTGRVAMNETAGKLDSDQAHGLYEQIASIHDQIVLGGNAESVREAQNELSQEIYSDTHSGNTPPVDGSFTRAGTRQTLEAGRIALNLQAENLTADQAQSLSSQLGGIHQQIVSDKQADGGTLSGADEQAINELQNQLSRQIYETVQGVSPDQG